MNSAWRPDDSMLKVDRRGQIKGAQKVKAAQRKFRIPGNKVMTSRDKGVASATRSLKRTGSPAGVRSWHLPIVPGQNSLIFYSELAPGARVPKHHHECDVFRIVMKGSLKLGRKVLGPGDWLHVPAGEDYEVEAGPEGCIVFYTHW